MQIGLLGKANVGKSTFFSAATETAVQTGNFPFTTIEPNVGVAHVRAPCACGPLGVSHETPECRGGTRLIPVRLIDVAGLVPGAHEGKGLGNKFLDAARQADALIHVIDAAGSTDLQGQPVKPGTHDPAEDARFVVEEFDAWFGDILRREWQKLSKEIEQKRSGLAAAIARRFSGLGIGEADVAAALQSTGLHAKGAGDWGKDDVDALARTMREASKPMLIAANKADLIEGDVPGEIAGQRAIPCSSESELLLGRAAASGAVRYSPGEASFEVSGGATPQQRAALETVSGILGRLGGTGVQRALDEAVFGVLGMIVAYPVEDETRMCDKDGRVLPRALLLRRGSTAIDLAREVHAEIAEGFLHGIDCKTGRRVGADHELADGDVIKVVSTKARGG